MGRSSEHAGNIAFFYPASATRAGLAAGHTAPRLSYRVVTPGRAGAVAATAPKARLRQEQAEAALSELEDRIALLEARLEERVVVVRELSREDAKKEILDYFLEHPDRYPSDAAAALRLDAAVTRDLCNELIAEGRLG